jgi:hypothetical protein
LPLRLRQEVQEELWRTSHVSALQLGDDRSGPMIIGPSGKIVHIHTKTVRATQGVRLPSLEPDGKVAAPVIIPPEELKEGEPTLLQ